MPRLVVALFGPSGAGKTTIARQQTRLTVYDRDDPQWTSQGEKAFRDAIKTLARDPNANAVVIRAGATSTARRRTLADIAATHAFLIMPSKDVCHHQAGHRRRQDVHTSHASIETWYAKFDHDDQLPTWPGSWEQALTHPGTIHVRPAPMRLPHTKAGDPRGTRAWRALREQVYIEETHCWRCGTWVDQALPREHPMSRTVDHLDPVGRGFPGIPDRSRVRLAHRRCNGRRGSRPDHPQSRSLTVTIQSI